MVNNRKKMGTLTVVILIVAAIGFVIAMMLIARSRNSAESPVDKISNQTPRI